MKTAIRGAAALLALALPAAATLAIPSSYTVDVIDSPDWTQLTDFGVRKSNAAGQSIATTPVDGYIHAFLIDNGVPTQLPGIGDTGGGTGSAAVSINAVGSVVGWSKTNADPFDDTAYASWVYSNGVTTSLGRLGSGPRTFVDAINDDGQIVGAADVQLFEQHAFLWESGSMYDLNDYIAPTTPGWIALHEARGISNAGVIVGTGNFNGAAVAFRATPVAAVPEPTTWALALLGVGALAVRLRRS